MLIFLIKKTTKTQAKKNKDKITVICSNFKNWFQEAFKQNYKKIHGILLNLFIFTFSN